MFNFFKRKKSPDKVESTEAKPKASSKGGKLVSTKPCPPAVLEGEPMLEGYLGLQRPKKLLGSRWKKRYALKNFFSFERSILVFLLANLLLLDPLMIEISLFFSLCVRECVWLCVRVWVRVCVPMIVI